jgi:hypothetical protein
MRNAKKWIVLFESRERFNLREKGVKGTPKIMTILLHSTRG